MSKFLKLDANHKEIVTYLKENGIYVYDACRAGLGITDLFTFHKEVGFMEIKKPEGGTFYRAQLDFLSTFKGPTTYVKTKEDALVFAIAPGLAGLTIHQKKLIQDLLKIDKSQTFSVNKIDKLIWE